MKEILISPLSVSLNQNKEKLQSLRYENFDLKVMNKHVGEKFKQKDVEEKNLKKRQIISPSQLKEDDEYSIGIESNLYRGVYLNYSKLIDEENRIVNFEEEIKTEYSNINICFLVDTTLSMRNFIKGIENMIDQIIKDSTILVYKNIVNDVNIKISLVLYKDHDSSSEYLAKSYEFKKLQTIL